MKVFTCIFILFGLSACNRYLDADLNKSEITTDKVFSNDVTATAAVTAIYNTVSSRSPLSAVPTGMNAMAGLSAGELNNVSLDDIDIKLFQEHQINSQNSHIGQLWNCMYNIIYQANAVLKGINQSTGLSKATAKQLSGEALFMRAFTYFYLVNLFGDVPLAVETNYHQNQSLSRRPKEEVYTLIENDLLDAQSKLSYNYVTPNRVRPNRVTATALLARFYLFRQQYANAEAQASFIIGDSVNFKLTTKEDIDKTFLIGSKETIWQLLPVVSYANTLEGYYFIITSVPQDNVITDALLTHFESNDLRYIHWMKSISTSRGTFYFPYKYKQKYKNTPEYTECSVAFRLAEIYLIRAEARAHLNDLVRAESDLNKIRARAGLPNTTSTDQSNLLFLIENERWSELFTEYGHRWLDLKRTGRAVEVLGNGITQDKLLFPLPASEFIKNPNLGLQNDSY